MNSNRTAIINNEKIEISFEFDMEIIKVVREIDGRKWDAVNKMWTVPFTPWHCLQVVEGLRDFDFFVDPLIKGNSDSKAKRPKLKLPEHLYPYQKTGVEFIYNSGGRCILADDMGLGKTLEALAFVDQFCGKTLVVSPANVLFKWQEEVTRWTSKTSAVITKGKQELPDVDIHIMSYAIATAKYAELAETPYNCIILDESHYIKSHRAQRTRVLRSLIKAGIPHALFLSGTPFMNRPLELFTSLNILDPKSYSNFYQFASRYCGAEYINGQWFIPPDGATNLVELTKRLSSIMIRRTKAEVLPELPELTRTFLPVEIDNMPEYKAARRDMAAWLKTQDRSVLNPEHVLTRLGVLRQVAGKGKVSHAISLAEDILEGSSKVVLFAHHKDVVSELATELKKYGVGVISGDTKPKDRQRIVNEFLISDSKIRVIIMTVAGAEGINLFSASNIIFVEREWVPAKEEQSEARLHRIGQKSNVTAHYLVALNTVDEKLNELVKSKRALFSQVIKTDEIVELLLEDL